MPLDQIIFYHKISGISYIRQPVDFFPIYFYFIPELTILLKLILFFIKHPKNVAIFFDLFVFKISIIYGKNCIAFVALYFIKMNGCS